MWIVAGPNGAGKSTFTAAYLQENVLPAGIVKLNADEVTAGYREEDKETSQDELNLRAARAIDAEVTRCILQGQSFLVETVLSSGKYRESVSLARRRGFQFNLAYISLFPPELSPARVSERVIKGGHAVAWDKAIARYHRSHQELAWFAEQADIFMIFDNSADDGVPVLIASRNGRLEAAGVMAERYHQRGVNQTVDEVLGKVPGFDDQE